MRATQPRHLLPICIALLMTSAASADPLDDAAIHAEPQYYLMSLPAAPVGDIAEAVLGEALGLPYQVDDDVDAQMRFQVDGMYAPKALAREFGYRLWNVDIALVERPSTGLWLIPKAELPAALAQGASLVSPLASAEVPARKAAATPAPVRLDRKEEEQGAANWAWLAWVIFGWAGGAVSVVALTTLRRRRSPARSLLLTDATEAADPGPDDLVIPSFPTRTSAPPQPMTPLDRN